MTTTSCSRPSTEYLLGRTEALLAGTLALMTAVAQGCRGEQRVAMLRKVLANLAQLEHHPGVSPQFQAVSAHLQQHWSALAGLSGDSVDPAAWQAAPRALQ